MDPELNEKVPCEECIILAICIANLTFIKNPLFVNGYETKGIDICNCSFLKKRFIRGPVSDWIELKQFLMKKKGITI